MASEQVVADLRAIITAHGFKETQAALDGVRSKGAGAASGLKSLFEVMNKANEKAKEAKVSFDKMIQGMSAAGKDASPSGRMLAGMSEAGKVAKATAEETKRLNKLWEETAKTGQSIAAGPTASGLKSLFAVMKKGGTGATQAAEGTKKLGRGTQKMNQIVQQASFGLQDFAITLGQGGLGMALRSASNNAAQIGAIFGGIGGAVAGIGVTLLSLIPDIVHVFSKMKEEGKAALQELERRMATLQSRAGMFLGSISQQIDEIRQKAGAKFDLGEMARKGDVRGIAMTRQRAEQTVATEKDVMANLVKRRDFIASEMAKPEDLALQDQIRQARKAGDFARVNQLEQQRAKKGFKPGSLIEREKSALTFREARLEILKGQKPSEQRDKEIKTEMKSIAVLKAFIANLEEFAKQIDESAKKTREAKAAIGEADKAEDKAVKNAQTKRQADDATKQAKAQDEAKKRADRIDAENKRKTDQQNRARLKGLEGEKKGLEGILEVTDPIGAKLQKIEEKFREHGAAMAEGVRARGGGPAMQALARGNAFLAGEKAKQDFLKKQQPGISGTFGVADFSRQLQNALLKDDTNKMIQHNTAATKANTAATVKKLEDVNRGIANLKSLKGVFGP